MTAYLDFVKKKQTVSLFFLFFLFLSFSFFFSSSCRLYNLERKLDPVNAEFLSHVQYIITKEERKIFLELPDSEKEKFKEEFWKRRDPDPGTEENEFKQEYMDRLEKANELFTSEGKAGYLTDRGRIYILFGPPQFRETHPIESADPFSFLYGRCGEIWHYGGFPVIFVDRTCTGIYRLETYDLTSLREFNLMYMHELSKAQARAQRTFEQEKGFFDFNWKMEKRVIDGKRLEGRVIVEIPYGLIWYSAENKRLKTTLDLRLELRDFQNELVWEHEEAFEVSLQEEELPLREKEMCRMEIPFVLEESFGRLQQGKNLLQATLKNRTGAEEARKVLEFKL